MSLKAVKLIPSATITDYPNLSDFELNVIVSAREIGYSDSEVR